MGKVKIKAKLKGDKVQVKCMFKHPMLTYDQAKKKGVDANFITHVNAKVNDKVVLDASTSQFLSKNPIVKFSFKADGVKKGDKLEMSYVDLKGNSVSAKKAIK